MSGQKLPLNWPSTSLFNEWFLTRHKYAPICEKAQRGIDEALSYDQPPILSMTD